MAETRRRSFWGWGYEDEAIEPGDAAAIADLLAARFSVERPSVRPAPKLADLTVPKPRIAAPAPLPEIISTDAHE